MREEFQKRRGYDLLPLLPAFTGRVVDSLEVSERFLWDLRQTVSDMLVENYAGHIRTLANRQGSAAFDRGLRRRALRRDDLRRPGGRADGGVLVVGQVRRGLQLHRDVVRGPRLRQADPRRRGVHGDRRREMAGPSGLHQGPGRLGVLRRDQPLRLPPLRHAALGEPARAPGMSMGPWGLHYERTQTWWEQSKAWHEYLARCQYLLQQGLFVADICFLQPEGAPRRFAPPAAAMIAPYVRGGYNFDGCTAEVVLTRMSVKDGRIVLPDGMSYRVLVLPQVETMTPALLGKIKELVAAGATVVAPCASGEVAGLSNYPACDKEVKTLAADLWGAEAAPAKVAERRVGKGRILWGGALSPKLRPAWRAARLRFRTMDMVQRRKPGGIGPAGQAVLPADREADAGQPRRFRAVGDDGRQRICVLHQRPPRRGRATISTRHTSWMSTAALKPGENLIAVDATNTTDSPTPAGLIGMLTIKLADGRDRRCHRPIVGNLDESPAGLEHRREGPPRAGSPP